MSRIQPRRAPKQRRSVETRHRILLACVEILAESGFETLTTNAIASRAGVSITSLYHQFPNKHAVVCELYRNWLGAVLDNMDRLEREQLGTVEWSEFFRGLEHTAEVTWIDAASAGMLRASAASIPELRSVEAEYRRKVEERLARYLKHYGSRLSEEELLGAAHTLNTLHEAEWELRWATKPVYGRHARNFAAVAQRAVLQNCGLLSNPQSGLIARKTPE